ncbi:hypothetical protein GJAV_G00040410 [Gymnothorax javanicus]|nr:hypothetical protein GJAV_G00040410 [Gymnothorax javanicus]
MTRSLDFLIEHRMQENDILDTNKYVFAKPKSDSRIRGSDCLRKFASLCDAKYPETLTSTQLRKHIATLCQIMNLKDHELDQVARFMGYDICVHREYYRLTENTVQPAKMSKLLMAIECGTNVYKGKSLDEIGLELEEQDELPRSQKQRPDLDESSDVDQDSDEFPATHTEAKVRRSSKPDRNELPRSQKQRPDLDESFDVDQDSDEFPATQRLKSGDHPSLTEMVLP